MRLHRCKRLVRYCEAGSVRDARFKVAVRVKAMPVWPSSSRRGRRHRLQYVEFGALMNAGGRRVVEAGCGEESQASGSKIRF